MTGSELLDYLRTDVLKDAVAPYLWSDATLFMFLNEAQAAFARETYCLQDNSTYSITTTVPTAGVGVYNYALNANILYVYSANVTGDTWDLGNFTRRFIPSQLTTTVGHPKIFTSDEAAGEIRFFPVPDGLGPNIDGSYTITLRVARLPTTTISKTVDPEISSQYHLDLCEFVKFRCLNGPDVDGQSFKAADRAEATWNKRVLKAKREYYRLRSGNDATAVQSYTGIRRIT